MIGIGTVQDAPQPRRGAEMARPMVELTNVRFEYPGAQHSAVLKRIDFSVGEGDYISLVGPSGSGKSTLMNILGLLDKPTSGKYRLGGFETSELSDKDRTLMRGQRIGFVFQDFHLMRYRSAVENVELSLLYAGIAKRLRRARATESLDSVGLGDRLHALPTELSGGERQRVAIARAIVTRPQLLLCDEPTGNLDSITAEAIMALVDDLHSAGHTVIVITHNADVARRSDRVYSMKDGLLESSVAATNRGGCDG